MYINCFKVVIYWDYLYKWLDFIFDNIIKIKNDYIDIFKNN